MERGGFLFQSLAQAFGTLLAGGVVYVIGVLSGVIQAVPLATVLSGVASLVAFAAALLVVSRPRLLRRRSEALLRDEPGRVVEPIKRTRYVRPDVSDESVAEAIGRLPEREKLVLTLRYAERLTLAEIGEVLGVTRNRVRQLETSALRRLRAELGGEEDGE
jgi:Sigma-70, region 4